MTEFERGLRAAADIARLYADEHWNMVNDIMICDLRNRAAPLKIEFIPMPRSIIPAIKRHAANDLVELILARAHDVAKKRKRPSPDEQGRPEIPNL